VTVRIINADVMEGLRQLPDESVHCVVSSPPYYGLRDYQHAGQIGLEATQAEHVAKLVEVFREVRRVLRKDGTLWLNYGDCYVSAPPGNKAPISDTDGAYKRRMTRQLGQGEDVEAIYLKAKSSGLKPKDLMGMPWRVAFALQADGWWLRSDIIWHKPNPMPESVTDRPTKSHEYVFLLAKSERYFYDAEAIKEEGITGDLRRPYGSEGSWALDGRPVEQRPNGKPRAAGVQRKQTELGQQEGGYLGSNDPFATRNKRSVWSIATAPFAEAHFATFPPELPEICIRAGTSAKGCCAKCGSPWARQTEHGEVLSTGGSDKGARATNLEAVSPLGQKVKNAYNTGNMVQRAKITTGWKPTCECFPPLEDAPACFVPRLEPCTVLYPFSGAGTTCLVADRLQRHSIGIEINPEYAAMAQRRIDGDRGGLLDVMEAAQ
jgi:DNA modification methylase